MTRLLLLTLNPLPPTILHLNQLQILHLNSEVKQAQEHLGSSTLLILCSRGMEITALTSLPIRTIAHSLKQIFLAAKRSAEIIESFSSIIVYVF
jgi:hypothetical protein